MFILYNNNYLLIILFINLLIKKINFEKYLTYFVKF